MKVAAIIIVCIGMVVLIAALAIKTGAAHRIFFKIYAFVKGDGLVAPNIFRLPPTNSPYERWLQGARTRFPMFEGRVVQDIEHTALKPWPQLGEGVSGLYLRFADYQMTDGRLVELPVRGRTTRQRQLYEQGIYILSGSGFTTLRQHAEPEQRVEWQRGDLFSVPLNVEHRHFNSGGAPARMLIVSSFPMVLNIMNSEEFIAQNDFNFSDRYDGARGFSDYREQLSEYEVAANFVANVPEAPTVRNPGAGNAREFMHWLMAGNSMLKMHVSELPPKCHLKAHRHTSDAFILLLSGEGFSLAWPEGNFKNRMRVAWKAGTLFVPPTFWYHQHFNPGPVPARHLAINVPDVVRNLGLNFNNQLEVDSNDVRKEWERALNRSAGQ